MSDDERAQVGTCYKLHGQDAAIALGAQAGNGEIILRAGAWMAFAGASWGMIYCFFAVACAPKSASNGCTRRGVDYPRVIGGYKAMRNFLMETLEKIRARIIFSRFCRA